MPASGTESETAQADGHETKSAGADDDEARRSPSAGEKSPANQNDHAVADPNIVDWDGPDDPANPRNWSKRRKMLNVMLVSLSVLYSYVWIRSFPICARSSHRVMAKTKY